MYLTDIESARVTKKMSNEYLEIITTKRIGLRRRFPFLIEKNEKEIMEILNHLIKSNVNVYRNPKIPTSVKFNSETGKFEC